MCGISVNSEEESKEALGMVGARQNLEGAVFVKELLIRRGRHASWCASHR